jgi:hypothetical protein
MFIQGVDYKQSTPYAFRDIIFRRGCKCLVGKTSYKYEPKNSKKLKKIIIFTRLTLYPEPY